MDIRELKYFTQVAKEKNFTVAARNLHISQPALSKTIKNLEHELDIQLFDRSDKEIKLTEMGEFFFIQADGILQAFDSLKGALYDKSKLNKGEIIVGLPPVIGTSIFVNVLTSFREKYPDITLHIVENGAKMVEHNLQKGLIDIGVVISPVNEQQFEYIPIMKDESVLIVHENHWLSELESVTFDDLREEEFLLLDKTFMLHHHIINRCVESGYKPNIAFESSQWDFLVELVAQNQGISILPRPILERVDTPHIRTIPFNFPPLHWDVGFLLNRDQYVTHVMKTFIDHSIKLVRQSTS
ncbi:LysR family transcriptional regulator [Pontibacillus litoralis]|uniref:LysR family transcriptional regulator n=1 Tax=Pontibacillus litoralis JSM 072002 TaxID=1385512 RepID=A0A0A5G0J5_9BACI|nr:LysR family transcriptional regulator [Pontibacillus litoralis]KGX86626.1 LysR family transcriptional regulator [Pontibacillus litoralis JSM 072002]